MNFKITKIDEILIPELVKLVDSGLGIGYISQEYFLDVLYSNSYNSWVVLNEKNRVIAFLTSYVSSVNEVSKIVDDEFIIKKLNDEVVCIDKLVVDFNYRKRGLGKRLLNKCFQEYEETAEYIMYAWSQKGVINMQGLATYYGFKKLNEYPNIWASDCNESKFICPTKEKDESCCCSAILYYLKQTK